MSSNFKKSNILLIVNCFLLVIASPVSAAGLVPCSGPDCNACSLLQLISNVINFIVLDITMPLAGLLFLIGGIMMVAAGGSEEWFKKGKKVFLDTVIGVLIILGSWVIVNTLITTFGSSVEGFVPINWWNVKCE